MHTASGLKLSTYWQSLCNAGEQLPLRSSVQPENMKPMLADLMIVETLECGGYHVRLAGTRLVRRLGWDPTGDRFTDSSGDRLSGLTGILAQCRNEGVPVEGCIEYPGDVESFDGIECVAVPFRTATEGAMQFLIAFDFVFAAMSLAAEQGTGPLRTLS